MDSRNSVRQTIEEVETLTGCPVQIVQDSSIKNMAVLDIPSLTMNAASPANDQERKQKTDLRQTGTLRRINRFANALIDCVPVRDKDRPGSDVDLLDWLRQSRRAGLYAQGRAIYEKGGLNLANLTDGQQIEAEDDYRLCVRRGSEQEGKPKKRQRKMKRAEDDDE